MALEHEEREQHGHGGDRRTGHEESPVDRVLALPSGAVVGTFEEIWTRLRAAFGDRAMPRTLNFITGPSRSADIEQKLQMGAHGPRRLHIVIVEHAAGP